MLQFAQQYASTHPSEYTTNIFSLKHLTQQDLARLVRFDLPNDVSFYLKSSFNKFDSLTTKTLKFLIK